MHSFEEPQKNHAQNQQTIIHPKLEVGNKDDAHEKEASEVAGKVMRMSEGETIHRKMGDEDEKKNVHKMHDEDEKKKVHKMHDEDERKTIHKMHDEDEHKKVHKMHHEDEFKTVRKMHDEDEKKKVHKMHDEDDHKVMKKGDVGNGGGMVAQKTKSSENKTSSETKDTFLGDPNLVYYINTEGTRFVDAPNDWDTKGKFNRLPKGSQVQITDRGEKEHFNSVSEEMKWVKVHLRGVPMKKYKEGFEEVSGRNDGWLMLKFLSVLPQQPISDEDHQEHAKTKDKDPYQVAPNAFHGIAPYLMAYEKQTPEFDFSIGSTPIQIGSFKLIPNCINVGGKTEVVYYTATDYNKNLNAYIVGPDSLSTFIAFNDFYSKHAQQGAEKMQTFEERQNEMNSRYDYNPDPYSYGEYSAMAIQCGMNGDWKGYWYYLGRAWKSALTDPFWWVNVGSIYAVSVPENEATVTLNKIPSKADLAYAESQWINNFIKNNPGMNFGVFSQTALSTNALRVLSNELGGMEVAQIFVKQGNEGYYQIFYGTSGNIVFPEFENGTPYLINHLHPSGNPMPSLKDIELLKKLQDIQRANGMPVQSSSEIIPADLQNAKFNVGSKTK
jgi:hypothetical protein